MGKNAPKGSKNHMNSPNKKRGNRVGTTGSEAPEIPKNIRCMSEQNSEDAGIERHKENILKLKLKIDKEKQSLQMDKAAKQRKKEIQKNNKQRELREGGDEKVIGLESRKEDGGISENGKVEKAVVREPLLINGKLVGFIERKREYWEIKDSKGNRVALETKSGTFTNKGRMLSHQKVGMLVLGWTLAKNVKNRLR